MSPITVERRKMMETAILSMSPAEQIGLVYDHAIMNLEAARDLGPQALWEDVRVHLQKSQKAVALLMESLLNPQAPGVDPAAAALADNFRSLYLYVNAAIIKADMSRTPPPYASLLQVLGDLAEGWKKGVLGRD